MHASILFLYTVVEWKILIKVRYEAG